MAQITVFEAPNTGNVAFTNGILNKMATTVPLINQLSSSWFFVIDANTRPILYEMALQGQSFFQAAGDQGSSSWGTDPGDIRDEAFVTVVGGTTLLMSGTPPAYLFETPWNIAGQGAGGGGIAANVAIPSYQAGISTINNLGSTMNRNLPDVSVVATNLYSVSTNPTTGMQSSGGAYGTSAAAPLWAAFVALANQQDQANASGIGTVGSANTFIYATGQNATLYGQSFNDIVGLGPGNNSGTCRGQAGTSSGACAVGAPTPTNTWTPGTGRFPAVSGYDLATGWGTPKSALINKLAGITSNLAINISATQTMLGPDVCVSGTGFTLGSSAKVEYSGIPRRTAPRTGGGPASRQTGWHVQCRRGHHDRATDNVQ